MAALTKERATKTRGAPLRKVAIKVAAGAVIFAGGLVAVNANGFAVPASDTAGLVSLLKSGGIAVHSKDNTGGADGDLTIEVYRGVAALLEISGAVVTAEVGTDLTVVDDQTVGLAAATTNDIVAGTLDEIDPVTAKAWVWIPG